MACLQKRIALDFLKQHSEDNSHNFAIHDINNVLLQHGLNCQSFGLPSLKGYSYCSEPYNPQEEAEFAKNLIPTPNSKQFEAFNKIIAAIDNNQVSERFFYLDGLGGSGKTYLHTTLISYVRGREQIASPFATTGIASNVHERGTNCTLRLQTTHSIT